MARSCWSWYSGTRQIKRQIISSRWRFLYFSQIHSTIPDWAYNILVRAFAEEKQITIKLILMIVIFFSTLSFRRATFLFKEARLDSNLQLPITLCERMTRSDAFWQYNQTKCYHRRGWMALHSPRTTKASFGRHRYTLSDTSIASLHMQMQMLEVPVANTTRLSKQNDRVFYICFQDANCAVISWRDHLHTVTV